MKELSLMLYKQPGPRVVCTHLEGPGPLRREYRNHILTLISSEWKIWGRHLRKEYRRSEAGLDLREPDVSEECLTSFGVASSYLIINSW